MKTTRVELVCGFCGKGQDGGAIVETHELAVDQTAYEEEVCDPCWDKLLIHFAPFATTGRKVKRKARKAPKTSRDAVAFPGTPWRFSSHAMTRLGQRKIDPVELLKMIESPTVTRPGNSDDVEIRENDRLKAVVAPERFVIVTAAYHDEDLVGTMP